jgi:hypothetical protein
MKLLGRTLTSLLLFVVYQAGMAYAQTSASVIRVNIPFEFNVGDKTFPAGDYSLTQPMQHFLVLRDQRGHTVASSFTSGVDVSAPVSAPTLRFSSVGGTHTLSEVWQAGDPSGQRLMESSKQRSMVANRRSAEAREAAEGSQP